MLATLNVVTATIVSLAMALSVAHALELPGKMRLSKEEYFAVQRIYYPGFTFGGMSEPAGIVATLVIAWSRTWQHVPARVENVFCGTEGCRFESCWVYFL